MLSIIWAIFGGLLRGLVKPVLDWFHDSAVRQQAIVDTLSDVKRHEAEALQAAVMEVKHNEAIIENADDLQLMRLNAAYRDAILADRLHKSHGND